MTPQEFEYIRRAVEVLEAAKATPMAQVKILRTMSQICGKSATELEKNLVDTIEDRLYNSNLT
jgi:hypothetical protein